MPMVALLQKEVLEQWRTRRLWVLAAVFLFFGLLSPITAQLTPQIVRWAAEAAPGLVIQVPPPSVADAVAQYLKNLSQVVPLAVVLVAMGSLVGEKEKGTLPMVLARPVSRGMVLAAKFLALVLTLLVALALGAVAAYYYTVVLFGGLPAGSFLLLNAAAGLFLLLVLALTFMASTVMPSTVTAGALAFGLWLGLAAWAALPRIGRASPVALYGWASRLGLGQGGAGEWAALGASLGLIAVALLAAWLHFRRQEL